MANDDLASLPPPPPVSPYLSLDDARAALEFYPRAFGAKVVARNDAPDGRIVHASLLINGGLVMLCDDFSKDMAGACRTPKALGGTTVTLHLDVPDVDGLWAQAVAAGATPVLPLQDQFWGDRYGILLDPFGHRWSVATRKRQVTKGEIAEATAKHFPAK